MSERNPEAGQGAEQHPDEEPPPREPGFLVEDFRRCALLVRFGGVLARGPCGLQAFFE